MTKPEYRKAVLDNGVTLVAEKHSAVRAVSIGVWVKVGSSFEVPSLNGVSHFIEHMTFKGTETRAPIEIATVLESLGGDLNAFTDREVTCYHATALSEHVDVALDVLSDIVLRPTFPKQELERERKVLLQELSMVEDSPEDWIHDLHFQAVWKGESIGQPIIGNRKTIQNISRASLLQFFEDYYRPENMIVSVSGNVDFDHLRERCEHYFKFKKSQDPLPLKLRKPKYHPRHKHVLNDAEQLHLLLGFEGISFRDSYRFDALILSFFLGGGMSSRLFQEIREKAGLAYTVDCDFIPYSETGLFTIYAAMAPRSLGQCMEILSKEVERLKQAPLTKTELALVKGQLKGTILLSSDQMDTRQESVARNEIIFGRYISVDEVIEEIERVSAERIHELVNRIFVPEKEAVVTLSRAKPKKKVTVFA